MWRLSVRMNRYLFSEPPTWIAFVFGDRRRGSMFSSRAAVKTWIVTRCLDRRKSVHGGYERNILFRTFQTRSKRSLRGRDLPTSNHCTVTCSIKEGAREGP